MTDHYEYWLRTVQWLITMSTDWGPFNDWSLWVLIKERSMTTNYECVWLFTDSAHLKLCRDSWTTTSLRTMIKNSIMNIISSVPMERLNVSVRYLLTVFVPCLMYFNIAFLYLIIVSCVQSWDIHIQMTICIVLPQDFCCLKCTLKVIIHLRTQKKKKDNSFWFFWMDNDEIINCSFICAASLFSTWNKHVW